jgi:hypothetical protein
MMGAYVLLEGKLVGGRCVWQREGVGLEAYIYYAASGGQWFVNSIKAKMESGTAAGCMCLASAAMTPDAATEQWRVAVGGAFQDAPQIMASTCTEDERQTMAQQAEQAEEEAVAMAQQARVIVLAGQEAGEPQHCMMGVYALMEGKLVGGRCVWQREGAGLEAYIHYAGSIGQWYVGESKANMESGVSVGRVCVASAAPTPDAATEQWRVSVGGAFVGGARVGAFQDAPQITASTCTEDERQAMVRQAEEEAVAMAQQARIIVLAGQEAGEPLHGMMGAYVLMEGKLMGGRCVWQREGAGLEAYIYFVGIGGQWFVNSIKANMESGTAAGCMNVVSAAMTPDAATEQWRVAVGGAFQDAPQVTASTCTEDERQAMAQQAEEEAVAVAQQARIIVLAGQKAGEPQHCLMGAYVLMEGKLVGGRCVWQREGAGLEAYIHYVGSRGHWFVGVSKANMESGVSVGRVCVASAAPTPDAATEQWRVFVGRALQDAPQITVSTCTEDERQAMAQQAEQEAVAMAQQA